MIETFQGLVLIFLLSRLAQELGLHKQKEVYQSSKSDLEETLNLLWYEQTKKRLWINLFVWDG